MFGAGCRDASLGVKFEGRDNGVAIGGPYTRPNCVPLCAARTLNATGQPRVTLSLR